MNTCRSYIPGTAMAAVLMLAAFLLVAACAAQPAWSQQTSANDADSQTSETSEPVETAAPATESAAETATETGQVDNLGLVALASIIIAGLTIAVGSIGPALGEGRAVAQALSAIAQQPDSSNTITRTLFVGLAMVESTAIYCFVVSMILLFANPFWNYFTRS